MGTWGNNIFEDDCALDLLSEFEGEGFRAVSNSLRKAAQNEEYLDHDDGSRALAAAAIIAAANGHKVPGFPKEFEENLAAVRQKVTKDHIELAKVAVARVMTNSETRELWMESGSSDWDKPLRELALLLSREPVELPKKPRRKIIRLKLGDVFLVPAGEEKWLIGQVIMPSQSMKSMSLGVYAALSFFPLVLTKPEMPSDLPSHFVFGPILTWLGFFIEHHNWKIVGNAPIPEGVRELSERLIAQDARQLWAWQTKQYAALEDLHDLHKLGEAGTGHWSKTEKVVEEVSKALRKQNLL